MLRSIALELIDATVEEAKELEEFLHSALQKVKDCLECMDGLESSHGDDEVEQVIGREEFCEAGFGNHNSSPVPIVWCRWQPKTRGLGYYMRLTWDASTS